MIRKGDDEASEKPGTPTLQTVERAFTFLEHVAASSDPPTVQQVAQALKLNITTCYHLMRTLVARGYLTRLSNGTLVVGNSIGPLYRAYRSRLNETQELYEIVRQLAEKTSETAFFSAPDGDSVVLKILVEGSLQSLRVGGLFVGVTGNEHLRASSRAILPYLEPAHRDRIVKKCFRGFTEEGRARAAKSLSAAMDATRQRGWALDAEESQVDVTGMAVPIFDDRQNIYGALGVVVPTTRWKPAQRTLIDTVSKAGDRAIEFLTYAKIA
jgi:IclR family transcriptional regulator, acetate operon repressor